MKNKFTKFNVTLILNHILHIKIQLIRYVYNCLFILSTYSFNYLFKK